MQLARLFSRRGGRVRDEKISRPFDWEELERLTARLGTLHGRLETAQAIGHFGRPAAKFVDGFADTAANLRQALGAEDQEGDDENED